MKQINIKSTFFAVAIGAYVLLAAQTASAVSFTGMPSSACAGTTYTIGLTGCTNIKVSSSSDWSISPTPSSITYNTGSNGGKNSITVRWDYATSVTISVAYCCSNGAGPCNEISGGFGVNSVLTPSVSLSQSASSLCAGSGITLTATPTNGGSSPTYTFYIDGSVVQSGSSATYNSGAMSAGSHSTSVTIVGSGCTTGSGSDSNGFTVASAPSTGTLSASQNCNAGQVTISATALSGSNASWLYRYSENDGDTWSSWNTLSVSTSSPVVMSINETTAAATRLYQYQLTAISSPCSNAVSNTAQVYVYRQPIGGTLSLASQFCSSASVSPTYTGYFGTINRFMSRYQDNGGSWSSWTSTAMPMSISAPSATIRNYQLQAFVQNGDCTEASSNVASTSVYAPPTIGTLSPSPSSVCGSGSVTLSVSSMYGNTATWQSRYSDDNGSSYSGWNTFSTTVSTSQSISLSSTTVNRLYQFQLILQNGAVCSSVTASTSATVYSSYTGALSPGTLIEAYGSATGTISTSGFPGTFTKWQSSPDNSTWTDWLLTATANYYVITAANTYFRAVISNGACNPSLSSSINLKVYQVPEVSVNSVIVNQAEIALGNTVTLTSAHTHYQYKWSKNGTDISGATGTSLVVTEPASYQLLVKASATAAWASVTIPVYALGYQADTNYNIIVSTRIRKSGVTPSTNLYSALTTSDYAQSIIYSDGLAKPKQSIGVGQSPLGKDIVQPALYDSVIATSYLPYVTSTRDGFVKSDALSGTLNSRTGYMGSAHRDFYIHAAKIDTSTFAYAKDEMENAPLGRVLKHGAPGQDWQLNGKIVKPEFYTNSTSDVLIWDKYGPMLTTGSLTYYASKTLAVSLITDENGNQVKSYVNKQGQTVLKRVQATWGSNSWLETYYVYDTWGNLVLQVPPKAVASAASWTSSIRNQYCFQYKYDGRGRLVEKLVPGAPAPVYYIYDPLGRLVLTQDGNLRASNKWAFVKYDVKNRPVMTGLYTNTTYTTRTSVQTTVVDVLYSSGPWYEDRGTTLHGYTNQSFPAANAPSGSIEVFTVAYYDNYDFDNNGSADYSYTSQSITGEQAQGNAFGLATGSKRVVMGTSNWLYTYQFYDRFARPIQTRTNNHLSLAIDNLSTVGYDFEGKVLQAKTYHNAGGSNQVTIVSRNVYDFAGRLLQVYSTINSGSEVLNASYAYNELGQVVEKNLHNTGGSNYLQSVDYRFHLRGWLKSINNAQLSNDSGASNDDTGDYFGMELFYNTQDGSLSNKKSYNGNITAMKWKANGTSGAAGQRGYKYYYDRSERLDSALFLANDGSSWSNDQTNTQNEFLSYDANGNILSLKRYQNQRALSGTTITNSAQALDDLIYTYASGRGNRLTKVADGGLTTTGFVDGMTSGNVDYKYDTLGNLTVDKNKGISAITYNEMGKVKTVTFSDGRTISYLYDAAGAKLRVKNHPVSGSNDSTDYVGAFVYKNVALSFFSSPEGRVVKNGSSYEYQYAISDHQGNTRILFTSATPSAVTTTATFEGSGGDQSGQFSNVPTPVSNTSANHTTSGSKVIRMNQSTPVVVTKSIKVYAGDKIDLSAWSYYEGSGYGTSNVSTATMITAIATGFGGSSGGSGESLNIYNGVNSAITGFGLGSNPGDGQPAAFLNYILFDQNYKVMDMGWQGVPSSANFTKQQLTFAQKTVKEAGYLFVYLSYEDQSNVYVYFDDLSVTITPTNVIQSNEYYAHGMPTGNSWTRENITGNNFLGNGGTELNSVSQLYDLDFRSFDAVLGRMHQVDPMSEKYSSLTPYNFGFNNPITINDPNGADPPNPDYNPSIYEPWSADFEENYIGKDYEARKCYNLRMQHSATPGADDVGHAWEDYVGNYDLVGGGFGFGDLYVNPSTTIDVQDAAARGEANAIKWVKDQWGVVVTAGKKYYNITPTEYNDLILFIAYCREEKKSILTQTLNKIEQIGKGPENFKNFATWISEELKDLKLAYLDKGALQNLFGELDGINSVIKADNKLYLGLDHDLTYADDDYTLSIKVQNQMVISNYEDGIGLWFTKGIYVEAHGFEVIGVKISPAIVPILGGPR